jgi:hypothetical protein
MRKVKPTSPLHGDKENCKTLRSFLRTSFKMELCKLQKPVVFGWTPHRTTLCVNRALLPFSVCVCVCVCVRFSVACRPEM